MEQLKPEPRSRGTVVTRPIVFGDISFGMLMVFLFWQGIVIWIVTRLR